MCISFPSTVEYITFENIKYTETPTTALSNSNLTLYNILHTELYALLQASLFTSLHSSTGRCRGFTTSSPFQIVLSYSSYSIPSSSSFPQNHLQPFFPSLLGSSFGSLPLYCNLSGHFWVSLIPHFYNMPKPSQLC